MIKIFIRSSMEYSSPEVSVVDVSVEKGFATDPI